MQTTSKDLIDKYTSRGWWNDKTLDSVFTQAATEQPDRLALADPPNRGDFVHGSPKRLTYQELSRRVTSVCAAFYAHGIREDDIVVVQIPNIVELPLIFIALARLGAIVSPVPVQYGRHELSRINESLGASAFVSTHNFNKADLISEHGPAFDGCKIFCIASDNSSTAIDLDKEVSDDSMLAACDEYIAQRQPSGNDIFTICWTSGTTGTPKGVPRSFNHWFSIAVAVHDLADMQEGDAFLNPFPMVNMGGIGGFLFTWLECRATLVLHHPMDLPVFLGQLASERISYTIAPPALLTMLLKNEAILKDVNLSHLRAIGSGSAPLPAWMVEGWEKNHGIAILNNFGSNEGMCLASGPSDVPDPAERGEMFPRFGAGDYSWSNRSAAMAETKLIDTESGEEITEPGVPGELLYRGPTIFDGYWNSPEANQEVFTDGYFHTGDLFEIAAPSGEPCYYKFVGRCKDIISRGGMKISPAELDNLLAGHPQLADVAVVGVPDEILGERVGVAVVVKEGESVSLDDVTRFLKDHDIAVFKLPESISQVDDLPRNPLGKVLRHELSHLFEKNNSSE